METSAAPPRRPGRLVAWLTFILVIAAIGSALTAIVAATATAMTRIRRRCSC